MHRNRRNSNMRRAIILLSLVLLTGCSPLKLQVIRYSDIFYKPVTREKLYTPYVGNNGLRSELQWQRNQNRWFNYYFLGLNDFYYNNYFGNNWYFHNQWRFNNAWRSRPPVVRPKVRRTPPTPPRRVRRQYQIQSPRRRGSTNQVSRNNPNPRTNVQPQPRQTSPRIRPNRSSNGRRNQNQ